MWVHESINTADFLSLHDCECDKLCINGNTIVFYMDWMEVLPEHPDNPYSVSHQSGEGQIEFIGCKDINLMVDGQDILLNDCSDGIVFREYDVLDFIVEKRNDCFYAKIYMVQNGPVKDISINMIFDSSITRFNELGDESWFVVFIHK